MSHDSVNGYVHPLQLRIWAERLVRRRGARERQRYALAQRRGRIDANPHQVDAVIFALARIPEGGCILADEVGLGKTIEAGLVMAQLLTEGMRRILIIVPKPLLGQWRSELFTLFGIEAREVQGSPDDLLGEGVFIVGREWAGGEAGASMLRASEPFELVIIDEAHEYFANVYRRYDAAGTYREDSPQSVSAGRVKDVVAASPVLLLTATPIQNTLLELWGLAQYVESRGSVLGDLPTFRELFCGDSQGREVAPERAEELKRRLGEICQRTLREQAKPFLETPFVGRHAQLFEYEMSDEERALYDDVTNYLLDPSTVAFSSFNRKLLLIGFHRRMASSLAALAASLDTVASRLERWLEDPESFHGLSEISEALMADFDDEEEVEVDEGDGPWEDFDQPVGREAIADELSRVRTFAERARALPHDSKAEALLKVVRERPEEKLVIFTESIATQDYLRELLLAERIPDQDITFFRGTNDTPRAQEALENWYAEVGQKMAASELPSRSIAARLALVHEFKTRSRIFISTEAGAKGLNLQFCSTLINYDLPWNPQRIEQRIGRCHRYGQKKDVTVVNFVATDNEAQKLTFELLAQKLELFGTVLSASDDVLHSPTGDAMPESLVSAIGADFTTRLQDIWSRARTMEQVSSELKLLRDQYDERRREFEASIEKTEDLIQTHLDDTVGSVFQRLQTEIPMALREVDDDIERLLIGWLTGKGARFRLEQMESARLLHFEDDVPGLAPDALPESRVVAIGDCRGFDEAIDVLHVDHPLVASAIEDIRETTKGEWSDTLRIDAGGEARSRGTMFLVRVRHRGLEPVEHIKLVGVVNGIPIPNDLTEAWVHLPWKTASQDRDWPIVSSLQKEDAIAEALYDDLRAVDEAAQERYEKLTGQIERYVEDRILVLRREEHRTSEKVREAEQKIEKATGPNSRRKAEQKAHALEQKLEEIRGKIRRLVDRDDGDYQKWLSDARRRRFERPTVERLFEADFELAGELNYDSDGR